MQLQGPALATESSCNVCFWLCCFPSAFPTPKVALLCPILLHTHWLTRQVSNPYLSLSDSCSICPFYPGSTPHSPVVHPLHCPTTSSFSLLRSSKPNRMSSLSSGPPFMSTYTAYLLRRSVHSVPGVGGYIDGAQGLP